MRVSFAANNLDRRAGCTYCYLHGDGPHAANTHVLKWQGGIRLGGMFKGVSFPHGFRRFACEPCAMRVRAHFAALGTPVGVYRYRATPGRRRAPRRRAAA